MNQEIVLNKMLVLILGGSTFMGKNLLQKLSKDPNYEVHFINRGKKYWNDSVSKIQNVHFTYGNRDDNEEFTKLLRNQTDKLGGRKWEAVIDFSAFKSNNVKSVHFALQGLVNFYVFISTDSIYDVCVDLKQPITEDQDKRPINKDLYQKFKADEGYGHNKLKCEQYLQYYTVREQFPFISLRLPDVIGPFDSTHRFFAIVKWLQQGHPVQTNQQVSTQELSFVYSADVTDFIIQILRQKIYEDKTKINQAYNLCCDEYITYNKFIEKVAECLKKNNVVFKHVYKPSTIYPSVKCGVISNQRAKQKLDFKPSKLSDAISIAAKFFVEEGPSYLQEDQAAQEKLLNKLK